MNDSSGMDSIDQGPEGLDWLVVHHEAKKSERRQIVADLGLKPGDRMLDLACGPGLWATMFAEQVAPMGKVLGVDHNAAFVDYGNAHCPESLREVIHFEHGTFTQIPAETETFDVAWIGNAIVYAPEPVAVIEEMKRIVKPGGRIIVKEHEETSKLLHPMDPVLLSRVLACMVRRFEDYGNPSYELGGRCVHGWLLAAGLQDVKTTPYITQRVAPVAEVEREYITKGMAWDLETARPYLTEEEVARWESYFDESSPDFVFTQPDFYFSMLEMVAVGQKGA